jgi:prepilin-type N-terminal cleavage/methylation domain-containing protein
MRCRTFRYRAGFTLVEMLVVVAIIGILAALTAGATMQVIGSQKKSNTEQTIIKVAAALDREWKAEVARAKEEPIPDSILNGVLTGPPTQQFWGLLRMASRDANLSAAPPSDINDLNVQRRARVIWINLRLKQRFPMNFAEALLPISPMVQWGGKPYLRIPPDPVFTRVLTRPLDPLPHDYESSVCLLLALSQGRGSGFTKENLASGELADSAYIPAGSTSPLKMIVDVWGRPLTFYRFPMGGEIAASNPYQTSQAVIRNLLDPDAVLMQPDRGPTQPGWNSRSNYAGARGVWAFERMFYPLHSGRSTDATYQPAAYYTVPVVASAGASIGAPTSGYLTVYDMMGLPPPAAMEEPPPTGLPFPLRHDAMDMVNNIQSNSYDNIYSFRLRFGGRGD